MNLNKIKNLIENLLGDYRKNSPMSKGIVFLHETDCSNCFIVEIRYKIIENNIEEFYVVHNHSIQISEQALLKTKITSKMKYDCYMNVLSTLVSNGITLSYTQRFKNLEKIS